jgi:hypothetical protein
MLPRRYLPHGSVCANLPGGQVRDSGEAFLELVELGQPLEGIAKDEDAPPFPNPFGNLQQRETYDAVFGRERPLHGHNRNPVRKLALSERPGGIGPVFHSRGAIIGPYFRILGWDQREAREDHERRD